MNIESEIKFSLDAKTMQAILKSRLIRQSSIGKPQRKRPQSAYFDTRQHLLRKAGVSLRVRHSEDGFEQTIKVPAPGPVGMLTFEEWDIPLESGDADLAKFDKAVLAHFNPNRRKLNLQPVFTTDVNRTTILIERDKSRFEIALDAGTIESHGNKARQSQICEIEFELLAGPPLAMLDFALQLSERFELHPEHRTKAARGYALVRSALGPRPTKARDIPLDADMTVGNAFRQIASDALTQLYCNEIPTIEGNPDGIHQARVSIRRIRAALRAFKKSLPYDKRKAFNGEFRWFQQRLSGARDWHVFLDETVPRIRRNRPNARVNLDRLHKIALLQRRRETSEAMMVFRSRRYTRLLLQFQCWLLALEHDNRQLFEIELEPFARKVLNKTRRDYLVDRRPFSRMTPDELHELRKRGKKARYATEFFAGLWQNGSTVPGIQMMKALQTELGEANDAAMARQILASLQPKALKPSTLDLVHSWSDQQVRRNIKSGQVVWRKFQDEKPFWLGPTTGDS
ncbi:MAG: CYTH and CHAD domain-containing protein [Gammaproteobacteria bacterium]|nr:CYTH and CHAD domain-containing protein [Gammaproteobacteria bacterium]